MIKGILYLLVVLMMAITSCKRESAPFHLCTAIINNEAWHARYTSSYKSPYINGNTFHFSNKHNGFRYALSLLFVRNNYDRQYLKGMSGNNYLVETLGYFSSDQESDASGDEYEPLESDSANNWMQITKAKKNFTRDIEGRFSGTFIRTRSFANSPFPDTIRIREGYFYIAKVGEG